MTPRSDLAHALAEHLFRAHGKWWPKSGAVSQADAGVYTHNTYRSSGRLIGYHSHVDYHADERGVADGQRRLRARSIAILALAAGERGGGASESASMVSLITSSAASCT